jgi:alpha-ketoglutarate-dependent taurine dioxygenase
MATTSTRTLTVTPVSGALGAEIRGVDLTQPQDDAVYETITAAFNTYGVVFLPDQHLTPEQHESFSKKVGEVTAVQELRKEPEQTRNIGESWHVDMTFRAAPPIATMLTSHILPERGGDTLWQSMAAAYDALSDGLKRTLLGMRAIHANVRNLGLSYERTAPPEPSVSEYDNAEGVLHPVVTRHPVTGRNVLFVNPEYTTRFEGWTRRESLGLLEYLYMHCAKPDFGVRLHWERGTIAWWDNRQVWHLAVNDYQGMRRVMSRSMYAGEVPAAATTT